MCVCVSALKKICLAEAILRRHKRVVISIFSLMHSLFCNQQTSSNNSWSFLSSDFHKLSFSSVKSSFFFQTSLILQTSPMSGLIYSRRGSKKTICSLWFWHSCDLETKSRSSILHWKCRPWAGYNYAKFENLALTVSKKKARWKCFLGCFFFFFKWGNMSLCVKI